MRAKTTLTKRSVWRCGAGSIGLAQPRLELVLSILGDGVELSVGSPSGLYLSRHHLPVTGEAGQGGIDLAEMERFAPAEVGVVVALEVVAIARFTLEEAKEGKRNAHAATINQHYSLESIERSVIRLADAWP